MPTSIVGYHIAKHTKIAVVVTVQAPLRVYTFKTYDVVTDIGWIVNPTDILIIEDGEIGFTLSDVPEILYCRCRKYSIIY